MRLRCRCGDACFILLLLIALLRMGEMAGRYSPTDDEAAHISSGIEWWQFATYNTEPPVPRPSLKVAFIILKNRSATHHNLQI